MTKRAPKFNVFADAGGQWRWNLAGANGEVVCQGEAHPTKAKALRAAESVQRLSAAAVIVVNDKPTVIAPAAKKTAKPAGTQAAKHSPR